MLGQLYKSQIDNILQSQVVGRIGCYANRRLYVVPITYAYDGKYIYGHSKEGLKIRMMRKNPKVCFEVDVMDNLANWRSVIGWGTFEELKDSDAQAKGMKILMDRFAPLTASETLKSHHSQRPQTVVKEEKAIVYRIKLDECTGRYEKSS